MSTTGVVLVLLIPVTAAVVMVLVLLAVSRSAADPRSEGPAEPGPNGRPAESGTAVTYLLQAYAPGAGWAVVQDRRRRVLGFGTATVESGGLETFANGVMRPLDSGGRSMRVLFYRGHLAWNELSIQKIYGDVTPEDGGRFASWKHGG